jgi:hypothetical protein
VPVVLVKNVFFVASIFFVSNQAGFLPFQFFSSWNFFPRCDCICRYVGKATVRQLHGRLDIFTRNKQVHFICVKQEQNWHDVCLKLHNLNWNLIEIEKFNWKCNWNYIILICVCKTITKLTHARVLEIINVSLRWTKPGTFLHNT